MPTSLHIVVVCTARQLAMQITLAFVLLLDSNRCAHIAEAKHPPCRPTGVLETGPSWWGGVLCSGVRGLGSYM